MTQAHALDALADQLRGRLVRPGATDFDAARSVWNARIDHRPAAVAYCAGTADVMAGIRFARERALPITVRGGGHSYAGHSVQDGAVVLDLSAMNGIWIDPVARRARVQAGVRWGAFDHEAQAFGLAAPGGTVSSIGVIGLALGGGTGFLVRHLGMTIDSVRAVDLVTADGRLVRADAESEAELFWGTRGGGANLGVAVSLDLELHEVGPTVVGGELLYPPDDIPDMLRVFRSFMAEAPDAVQCYAFLLRLPPLEVFPKALHGQVVLDLVVCHAGSLEQARADLGPLREFGEPFIDSVAPKLFTALQQSFDAGLPEGQRYYSRAHYLPSLSDAVLDAVLERTDGLGGYSVMYFEPLGGAVSRVATDATAFPHRSAAYSFHVLSGWTDPSHDDAMIGWTRSVHEAVAPHATGGVYVNLLAEDEQDRVPHAFGPNYQRLARLKRIWDPENVFRSNPNIPPGP